MAGKGCSATESKLTPRSLDPRKAEERDVRPTLPRSGPEGRPSILAEYHRPLSEYLSVALPLGFQVRHCEEPGRPPEAYVGPHRTDMSWELLNWHPEASAAAHDNVPVVVIWHFQLAD